MQKTAVSNQVAPTTGDATLSSQLSAVTIPFENSLTEKEKVERWFIEPLQRLKGDDGYVCLMLCFPLLECVMRFELEIPDDQDLPFSDNSPALHWFAQFMQIPEAEARDVWDAFRNGLLHRGMVKDSVPYGLTGGEAGRPAEFIDGTTWIYVWDLRDEVVAKLRKYHSRLWKRTSSPLGKIGASLK
jgi:hypothetical protein